jgi:hypothetical protein
VPGAGVIELLAKLGHPAATVLVAVTAVVLFTIIGLPDAELLQVSSFEAMIALLASFAVIVVVPSQLSTFDKTGAAGVVFGAGVTELLDALAQSLTVQITVRAVVLVTDRGLPVPPSLHVNWPEGIVVEPSFAVTVVVPSQLSTFDKAGALGVVFGAGVTELLDALAQLLTVQITVRAVVLVTDRGLPVPPSLHVN